MSRSGRCRSGCTRCRRCNVVPFAAVGFEHAPVLGVARPRDVAAVRRGAGHRVRAGAGPVLARVRLRARVPVAAARPVRRSRVGARARTRVARPRDVAAVRRDARHLVRPRARPVLARVRLGARVAVAAARAIRRDGLEHAPVPGLHVPATWQRVRRGARHLVRPRARPVLARVCLVHALPSLHGVPFAATGFEQAPVLGLHVPATWHASAAAQVT